MFTGLVQALGRVASRQPSRDGVTLGVAVSGLERRLKVGDSVAVNGACLTVSELDGGLAGFQVSPETLARCDIGAWEVGRSVNLETALTLDTPLGGHLVSGHVDGVGEVLTRREGSGFTEMEFQVERGMGRYLAGKGSVAVDGVSLTVNSVSDAGGHTRFGVMLVPHTLAVTTLGEMREGDTVHVEVDQLARYVERIFQREAGHA